MINPNIRITTPSSSCVSIIVTRPRLCFETQCVLSIVADIYNEQLKETEQNLYTDEMDEDTKKSTDFADLTATKNCISYIQNVFRIIEHNVMGQGINPEVCAR